MGKKARKLRSPKFATKSAALRQTVAKLNGVIEIDMTTGEETKEEETVQVVTNTPAKKETKATTPRTRTTQTRLETVEVKSNTTTTTTKTTTRKKAAKTTGRKTTRKTKTAKK